MHDLDRQQLEHDLDRQLLEAQQLERPRPNGSLGGLGVSLLPELELTETEELALAAEFLEIASEEELEEFLGNVLDLITDKAKSAGKAVRAGRKTATGEAVASGIKATIPLFTVKALSSHPVTQPFAVGGGIATRAILDGLDSLLKGKQELEGLSGEDREFELARQFIRFIWQAIARALAAPDRVPPPAAAAAALTQAARAQVPAIAPQVAQIFKSATPPGVTATGRWYRRGSDIVIDLG
jgi:hypothetical protein